MSPKLSTSAWETTREQNLIRYKPSGTYFARFKVGGKLIRKSLKTKFFSVAKARLPDQIKYFRSANTSNQAVSNGKMSFGDAVKVYEEQLAANPDQKKSTKSYYRLMLRFLHKTWPELRGTDIRKIGEDDCGKWLSKFQTRYAPTVVNNTLSVLRAVFQIAITAGAIFDNPAGALKRVKVRPKELQLPSSAEFQKFIGCISEGGGRFSRDAAHLVRFLAYSGLRVGESHHVTWSDVDFEKNRLQVRGDPETGTKNGEVRFVPLIPELAAMLVQLRKERSDEPESAFVMRVRECQKSMDRGAQLVGMKRITHHDLRHLFATMCIESGVDAPTFSRWLGHKDGGVLAMKTYGHLRDEHSAEQAKRVSFKKV